MEPILLMNSRGRSRERAETIDRLRGQLQNCVNHLEHAKRRQHRSDYDDVIESANKALYETLDS